MKRIVRFAAIVLLLCLVLGSGSAYADDEDLADKSWDEVIGAFLEEFDAQEGQVTIGYYNTVSGEEYFYDPDRYMVTASMFKVPLCMVFAEKEANGEISWDDLASGYRYSVLVEGAIVNSNNDYAEKLWKKLGSYRRYREIIAPYMGEDPETVDAKYYENNFFTARQMLTCLQRLYGDQETYGTIIDLMKRGQPKEYFRRYENRYEVAHKYGYLTEGYGLHLNDCAVVYTDEPYLLVCFTYGLAKPYEFLGKLCTLMSDYTQYNTARRLEEEAEAARAAEEAAREQAEKDLLSAETSPERDTPPEKEGEQPARVPASENEKEPWRAFSSARGFLLSALFAAAAVLTVFRRIGKGSVEPKETLFSLAALLLTLFFCLIMGSPGGAL